MWITIFGHFIKGSFPHSCSNASFAASCNLHDTDAWATSCILQGTDNRPDAKALPGHASHSFSWYYNMSYLTVFLLHDSDIKNPDLAHVIHFQHCVCRMFFQAVATSCPKWQRPSYLRVWFKVPAHPLSSVCSADMLTYSSIQRYGF